jgi:hypothetical protein
MSHLQRETPSGETRGFEGNKSSINNSSADHRQDLEKSYFRCGNDLQDWYIAKGYYKLIQLDPVQLYKEQVAYAIRRNNPFNLPLSEAVVFKSIISAHFKTKRTIENLYFQFEEKNLGGDL